MSEGRVRERRAGDLAMVLREPVGVVGATTAWNFPAVLFASKVPFALAAG